jgi:hypothetical protein
MEQQRKYCTTEAEIAYLRHRVNLLRAEVAWEHRQKPRIIPLCNLREDSAGPSESGRRPAA